MRENGGVPRLIAAVSTNVTGSVLTAAAGVGATGLLARRLPVSEFGTILLLLTAVNAFAIFEGLRPVVIHRVAMGRECPAKLFNVAYQINGAMAVVTIGCLVAGFLAGAGLNLPVLAKFFVALTVIAFFVSVQYWTFLDAEQDTVFTGLSRAVGWVGLYVSFGVLAILKAKLLFYTAALLSMYVLLAVVFRFRLRQQGFIEKYRDEERGGDIEPLMYAAFSNIVFNICAVTINVADRAIVGTIMGARVAGFYAGPSEFALRAVGLVRAGVQVVLPWAARLSDREQDKYWSFGALLSLVVVGSGCAVLLPIRRSVVTLLLGPAFTWTGDLLGLFSLGVVASTLGYVCIVRLNVRGDFQTQRRLYLAAATLVLAGASAGALSGNLRNVALAFLAARCVDVVLFILLICRLPGFVSRWFLMIGCAIVTALGMGWAGYVGGVFALLALTWCLAYWFWRTVLDS